MWIDVFIQLAVMTFGYAVGAGGMVLIARLLGLAPSIGETGRLVLLLPLTATLLAEASTGLWLQTPGTLGLGGLVAFMPLLVAGLAAALAAIAAHRVIGPPDRGPEPQAGRRTAWLGAAFVMAGVAILLWRYWPEPRARLW